MRSSVIGRLRGCHWRLRRVIGRYAAGIGACGASLGEVIWPTAVKGGHWRFARHDSPQGQLT